MGDPRFNWRVKYWLTNPRPRGRPPAWVPADSDLVKTVQKLEGHLERRRDLEAQKIGQEAVKHLGLDQDEPL